MPTYTAEEKARALAAARLRIANLKVKLSHSNNGQKLMLDTGGATGFISALLTLEVIGEEQYIQLAEDIADALHERLNVERARISPGVLPC